MKSAQRTQGFTLLEILIAITILGILTVIVLGNLGSARDSAQDKAMMAEFKQVQVALSLYKAQFGRYPAPGCGAGGPAPSAMDVADCGGTADYITGLSPKFIPELPREADSANSNCDIEYRTDASGVWYKLTAIDCIAGNLTLDQDDELARCPAAPVCGTSGRCDPGNAAAPAFFASSFAIYSQGGQCE